MKCLICGGAGRLPYRDGSGVYICSPCKGTGSLDSNTVLALERAGLVACYFDRGWQLTPAGKETP